MTVPISTTTQIAEPAPVIEKLEAAFVQIHRHTRDLPAAARRDVDQAVAQVLDGFQALLGVKVR
jgi:hypothetical protein